MGRLACFRWTFVWAGSCPGGWGFWALGQVQGPVWKLPKGQADCPPHPHPLESLPFSRPREGTQSLSGLHFLCEEARCSLNLGIQGPLPKGTFALQRLQRPCKFTSPSWTLPECRPRHLDGMGALLGCSPSAGSRSPPWCGRSLSLCCWDSVLADHAPPSRLKPALWVEGSSVQRLSSSWEFP